MTNDELEAAFNGLPEKGKHFINLIKGELLDLRARLAALEAIKFEDDGYARRRSFMSGKDTRGGRRGNARPTRTATDSSAATSARAPTSSATPLKTCA